jgi:superfamily II DNA or RNA helicase
VWLWSEWPSARTADAGIDLVAEEHDGGLWAIQAKAYDPEYAIKKSDVDSFLSESSQPGFTYRLLIATTDRLGPTARRTLDNQREPVGYVLRSQLELAEVPWPSSPDELRPRRPARKEPFPHVHEAIRATVQGFDANTRGQLIMACGTGKTLAALWISERLGSERTLVLVPSLSLLGQTLREWCANASGPFEYLAVCSDPTVVGEDQLVEHTTELGFPTTTDPTAIVDFLGRGGRRVVFATYQSSPQIAAAFDRKRPRFDLAVADEAHRCAGRTSSEFATILDAAKIRSRRRLFMTATPRFYTPRVRSEAGQLGVEVASMDNVEVFGPVLHRLSFGEAIERDLLSDYQVVVVGVDDEMYRAWAERGEFVTPDGKRVTDARSLAGQIGLAKSMRKYELRRIISFHSRVKAARRFSEDVPYVSAWMPARARPRGAIWSKHVSGAMTSGHRDRLLLRFRNLALEERGLLSNARCLGEGVDVPSIDAIAFIDPRRSTIDIVQALGRAIRKSADKRIGTIVLPVFLSATDDPDQALNESAFEHVWDVLKALRAHDETLGEELDELRRRLGAQRGALQRPERIKLDVPRTVGADFARAFDVRLVEQTTASWEFYFGLLHRFVERQGHVRVPRGTRTDGFHLGWWVNNQRAFHARGELDPDRERQLEGLSGWSWDPREDAWEEGFAHVRNFAEREGHTRVSSEHREDGYPLGTWVNWQRHGYRQGTLDLQRQGRLEALPDWTWETREAAWEEAFERLQSYACREGQSLVPTSYRDRDGFKLGDWVARQRQRRQRGTLTRERVRRLESLPGWAWDKREAAWEEAFTRLQSYGQREGHSEVPWPYRDPDGFNLPSWINRQRQDHRRGTLHPQLRRQLEALPGWSWNTRETAWEEAFTRLQSYVEREGHSRVPDRHQDDGIELGRWVSKQRQCQRRGTLADDRVRRLESLPDWTWNALEAGWDEAFERLQSYVQREGHSSVPYSYRDRDGFKLGTWVSDQRGVRNQGTLSGERANRLEALPGWSWDAREAAWEEGFAHLQSYAEREGHTQVLQFYRDRDGFRLGGWVSRQRDVRNKGTLSAERVSRLESMSGWTWDPLEAAWEEGFAHLQSYARREGHTQVPQSYRDRDRFRLGGWVNKQRQSRRQGTLSDERVRRLEGLPGWTWDPRDAAWEEGFAHLQSYARREGRTQVPQSYRDRDRFQLGTWVLRQRQARRRGTLANERVRRLESLPGWVWDARQVTSAR